MKKVVAKIFSTISGVTYVHQKDNVSCSVGGKFAGGAFGLKHDVGVAAKKALREANPSATEQELLVAAKRAAYKAIKRHGRISQQAIEQAEYAEFENLPDDYHRGW